VTDSQNRKNNKKSPSEEEDAAELLRAHLDAFDPPVKDLDISTQPTRIKTKSKKKAQHFELDLHGQTVAEAKLSCDQLFSTVTPGTQASVKIITGKGRHSGKDGPTLISGIYIYVSTKYKKNIVSIDSPPAEDRLNGLPLRGFFDLKFKA